MNTKTIKKLIAEKVHSTVLEELNYDNEFKSQGLLSYFVRMGYSQPDVSNYKLITKAVPDYNSVSVKGDEFEMPKYSFVVNTFNYVDKPKNEDIGLIPNITIVTNPISGSFTLDDSGDYEIEIDANKLVKRFAVDDNITFKTRI